MMRCNLLAVVAIASISGLPGAGPPPGKSGPDGRGEASQTAEGAFVDATAEAGIDFTHISGGFGMKWLPETNGAGAAFFDADDDGWIDLLLVQGSTWAGHEDAVPSELGNATMKLLHNAGDGTFTDVTAGSGLDVQLYGFAAAPADFDDDGDTDVYVTAYGPNRLFRNEGAGRFVDISEEAGVAHPGWGSCAAWLDYDGDADLDLFACNYLRWSPAINPFCTIDGENRAFCNPRAFEGESSVLYRNDGDGSFADVTREAGLFESGKSLGVAVADLNRDGWPDIAVANDTEPDFLFENRGNGTFQEIGLVSGMSVDAGGVARAGMGIDIADYRNDDRLSIAIGNFSGEMIGLFEPMENDVFVDVAPRSTLGHSSFEALTFGLFFFDYDLDGWLDLLAINGHIYDDIATVEPDLGYAQLPLLYRNGGDGAFTEVAAQVGGPLTIRRVGRGAAYADYDRDGDLDVIVTSKDGVARLWQNRARDPGRARARDRDQASDPERGDDPDRNPVPHVLRLRLTGTAGNRDAVGARATVSAGDWRQSQVVKSGSSYLSQSELTLTFGFGRRRLVDSIEVRWPGGARASWGPEALEGLIDHELHIVEGEGIVEAMPLGLPSENPAGGDEQAVEKAWWDGLLGLVPRSRR